MPLPLPVTLTCPRLALVDTLTLATVVAAVIIGVIKRDAIDDAIALIAALVVALSIYPDRCACRTNALVGTFEIQVPLHKFLIYLLEFSFVPGVSIA